MTQNVGKRKTATATGEGDKGGKRAWTARPFSEEKQSDRQLGRPRFRHRRAIQGRMDRSSNPSKPWMAQKMAVASLL
jgi:hypothetical protein